MIWNDFYLTLKIVIMHSRNKKIPSKNKHSLFAGHRRRANYHPYYTIEF
jgi:hypothetical protein